MSPACRSRATRRLVLYEAWARLHQKGLMFLPVALETVGDVLDLVVPFRMNDDGQAAFACDGEHIQQLLNGSARDRRRS